MPSTPTHPLARLQEKVRQQQQAYDANPAAYQPPDARFSTEGGRVHYTQSDPLSALQKLFIGGSLAFAGAGAGAALGGLGGAAGGASASGVPAGPGLAPLTSLPGSAVAAPTAASVAGPAGIIGATAPAGASLFGG